MRRSLTSKDIILIRQSLKSDNRASYPLFPVLIISGFLRLLQHFKCNHQCPSSCPVGAQKFEKATAISCGALGKGWRYPSPCSEEIAPLYSKMKKLAINHPRSQCRNENIWSAFRQISRFYPLRMCHTSKRKPFNPSRLPANTNCIFIWHVFRYINRV